jgi:hypothetical protein
LKNLIRIFCCPRLAHSNYFKTENALSIFSTFNADKEICKPKIYTQVFLVNMTLEKPPWRKPVEEKFYYGDLKPI